MPAFAKGYIDEEPYFFGPGNPSAVRSVAQLLRAQEHVTVRFILDEEVPRGEARCYEERLAVPPWIVNPADIAEFLADVGEVDWRPNELTPEDFYAA